MTLSTTPQQIEEQVDKLDMEAMKLIIEHWVRFAHFGTWQFWVNVVTLIVPLVIVFIMIDRKKIFQIAFFGYSFHMVFVYSDVF